MANDDKTKGVFSDAVMHLAALFRHMLPGVILMGGAYIAYPDWFKGFDLQSTGHLIVLSVITIAVGNTWFALNRYGLHQLVDLILYSMKSNGPARRNRFRYLDDLGRYTYKSLHSSDASVRAQEHVKFRASTVLLIFTLGEAAMLFAPFHSSTSIIEGHNCWIFFGGAVIFAIGVCQMVITRRIDHYLVNPPNDAGGYH